MRKTIAVFTLMLPLLLGGTAFAQDGHEGHAHAQTAAKKEAVKKDQKPAAVPRKITKAEIGKEASCAVTGEKFKIAEDTISMSYKGRNYYFCCPGCDKSFAENPAKFAVKKEAAPKVYVCPMNDYKGDKPGKCPKCGMTLKEKK
jgi:YHS domain-containing protein